MTDLIDHFHPPMSLRRHWHAFHNAWATYLSSDLNSRLPEGYFAEPNVQFGIEIDVATLDEREYANIGRQSPGLEPAWAPPAPSQTVAFVPAAETVEILVYDSREGPALAGAIELISPGNKDRPAHREAFVAKCESYLQSGVGLVIVDVVTNRQGNLHDALLARLAPAAARLDVLLYAAAYRPVDRQGEFSIEIWQQSLAIGTVLPTMPLWLRGGLCLPVDMAASYDRTCREQRV